MMPVITAMHQMHKRASQQQKIGDCERHMREVVDEQIDAEPCGDEAADKTRS